MNGGPGADSGSYAFDHPGPLGVTVDLGIAGPQATGGSGSDSFASVENVVGTGFADVLPGNGARNKLSAFQGDDTLAGRGGVDLLEAGEGADDLDARDGGADTADCGPQADTVSADLTGTDTLIACEDRLFPDVDPPETTITSRPKSKTRKRKATFGLASDEPGASLECRIDDTAFAPCSSPFTEKAKRRRHTFEARATDAAGNVDPTPALHKWKVKRRRKRK
jgi:Ca2+-binding RTX toxin-like protein